MSTKYYNVNEGVKGREGGPFLDRDQLESSGHGTQFVTGEQLLALHTRNTGETLTLDDITAPVAFEVEDEEISEPTSESTSESTLNYNFTSETAI